MRGPVTGTGLLFSSLTTDTPCVLYFLATVVVAGSTIRPRRRRGGIGGESVRGETDRPEDEGPKSQQCRCAGLIHDVLDNLLARDRPSRVLRSHARRTTCTATPHATTLHRSAQIPAIPGTSSSVSASLSSTLPSSRRGSWSWSSSRSAGSTSVPSTPDGSGERPGS